VLAFLDEAAFVHDADRTLLTKNLNRELPQSIPGGIRTPFRLVKQTLHGIWNAVTDNLGHLPAILARHRRHQSTQVLGGLGSRLLATKNVSETGAEPQKICAPLIQFLSSHRPSGGLVLPPLSIKWAGL
jgi:hypothetical protein